MKSCTAKDCEQNNQQPLLNFYKEKGGKCGVSAYCKACKNKKSKAYNEAHPEIKKKSMKAWIERNPDKVKANKNTYYSNNREHVKAKSKEWREANPDKVRANHLRQLYGISLEQYDSMVAAQENKCAICIKVVDDLCVDHDHNCCPGSKSCGKCVRGLLCQTCNSGLGFFKDSSDMLKSADSYLSKYPKI